MAMTLLAIYQVMSSNEQKDLDKGVIPVYIRVVLNQSGFTSRDLIKCHYESKARQIYKP